MSEVTPKKEIKIVELYFGGLSYNDILRRVGVGKGSVVKVIDDLKAGRYPELSGMTGELEAVRETAIRLKKEGMTPVRAALGLAVLEGLNSMAINPDEVPKAVALLRTLAPGESDQRKFAQAALYLWDLKQRTGKDEVELQNWVEELEDRGKKAEVLASEVEALEEQRRSLVEQKSSLDKEIKAQSERLQTLSTTARTLREQVKSARAALEALNESYKKREGALMDAEEEPNRANEALKNIRALGLAPQEWVPVEQTLQQIGKRYRLDPREFKEGFLKVAENYGSLLGMEENLSEKRQELSSLTEDCNKRREERSRLLGEVGSLKERKATLQGTLSQLEKQSTDIVSGLNQKITLATERAGNIAQQDIGTLVAQLTREVASKLEQERSLKEQLDVLESSVEDYVLLRALTDLVLERGEVSLEDLRFLSLSLLGRITTQLERKAGKGPGVELKALEFRALITKLEGWRIK